MIWSQLRSTLRERVALSLRDRLAIHQARYRHTHEEVGRVWLTLDKRELISFDTNSYVAKRAQLEHDIRSGIGPFGLSAASNMSEYRTADDAAKAFLRQGGAYDDYSALHDLEAYLSFSIDDAFRSESPLIRALAVVDRRVGKRRLLAFRGDAEHALVQELHYARCEADRIQIGARAI